MALIKLTASELEGVQSQISKMSSKASDCANKVSSVRNGLDMEITAKRNIEERLDNIKRDLTKHSEALKLHANILNDVINEFVKTDSSGSILQSATSITDWMNGVIAGGAIGGAIAGGIGIPMGHTGEMYNWQTQQQLEKIRNAASTCADSSLEKEETGFWGNLWNKGKKAVNSIGDKAKELYGNVVQAGKDCVSWVGDRVDDVKDWYNENEEAIKAFGKGALKVAAGAVTVVGSIAAIVGTGGASIPLTMLTAVGGINNIASGAADLIYASQGQYDMVGQTDALKEQVVDGAGEIGKLFGNEEAGEQAGEWLYTGYNAVNFLAGADGMLKSMGKVNTIATGSTGYSKCWGWTSFDDIADTKIKFKIDTDFGIAPDYAIRKILGIDGSSDANIVYEAGKNIYKSIESAGKLGKEIGENASNLQF